MLFWQNMGGFFYLAFNFKGSFAAVAATHIYVGFAQYLVYDKQESILMFLDLFVWSFIDAALAHMLITFVGSLLVKSELPRVGNEKLLNGL